MRAGSQAQRRPGPHAQHNQARHPKPSSGRGAKSIPATSGETTSGHLQPGGVLHAETTCLPSRAPNRPENTVPNAPVPAPPPGRPYRLPGLPQQHQAALRRCLAVQRPPSGPRRSATAFPPSSRRTRRSARSARRRASRLSRRRIGRELSDMVLTLRDWFSPERSAPGHGYHLVAENDRGRLRLARA
jgi:hypothetical protein